jgi:threonine dehydratase
MTGAIPTFDDVAAAARRLKGHASRTPVLEYAELNELLGTRVHLKPEMLQRTGSFKFRGAYNRLVQLSPEERAAGVVAFSSGNHAQGVAEAARLLGIRALIVMPSDAPAAKLEGTRARGAEVRLYDRYKEDREAIARRIAEERGALIVPSYDDPHIIAGQGTAALELAEDVSDLDVFVCPLGGGGLMAGSVLALKFLCPKAMIIGVEPEEFDDHRRSLEAGKRVSNPPTARSICDALQSPMPGRLTFAINEKALAQIVTVSDAEVESAQRYARARLKLVVEPGGAVALAAALAGKLDLAGKRVALLLSGGNV